MLIATIVTSCHAVLNKRDVRATIGWVGIIWLVPVVGVALYVLLGINRIKRKATMLRSGQYRAEPRALGRANVRPINWTKSSPPAISHMRTLVEFVGRVTRRPLLAGNRIEPLAGGDVAYPAMLAAIDAATALDDDDELYLRQRPSGAAIRRCAEAGRRVAGVEVRVLIDAIGSRYSFPSIIARARESRHPGRSILGIVSARLFRLCESAQPPQDSGRRRPHRLHRRPEYPRRRRCFR